MVFPCGLPVGFFPGAGRGTGCIVLAENTSFVWFYLPCLIGKSAGNSVNPIGNPLGPERPKNRPMPSCA